jgi:N-terminal domain of reverse transcriptase
MVSHDRNISELWRELPWKKFRVNLFKLQKRVYKAVQVKDMRKARSLQKLILKSKSARLLAIRQVTQLKLLLPIFSTNHNKIFPILACDFEGYMLLSYSF